MSNQEQEFNEGFSQAGLEEFLNSAFDHEFADAEFPRVELHESGSAFGRRIREFKLVNKGYKNIEEFAVNAFEIYRDQLSKAIAEFHLIKTISYFCAEFERSFHIDDSSEALSEKREIHIPTKNHEINSATDLREHFQNNIINYIVRKVDEALVEGSGFTLSRIEQLTVQIFKHEPLRGSGFIELPRVLKGKRAIVNLKNTFDECFKWSILAALHHEEVYAKNRNKVNDAASYHRWANELNFNDIDFPVRLNQIEKFMQQNEHIAVNVYCFDSEKKCVYPRFLASKPVEKRYIHLLMLTEAISEHGEETRDSHYCWIKNLSALVGSQMSKYEHKKWICDRCLIHFNSHKKLEEHKILCKSMNECAIGMPPVGKNYETFKNYKNELKIPFIIYADTEALLKEPETPVFNEKCSSYALHHHEVHSIGYYFKNENDESRSRYVSHRGADCIEWFMDELKEIVNEIFSFLEDKKPMNPLTEEEARSFLESAVCHICKKSFMNDQSDMIRVRDHCHITGFYRGAAHQSCNLQYQITRNIPVVLHNLSGYDSHLLIRKLGSNKQLPGEITIIPNNSERYISFIKTMHGVGFPNQNQIKLKFIDSMQFMGASLDYLASLIPPEKKQILRSECIKSGFHSDEMFALLNRKGVFPYEYVDKYERLEENALPSKESFYSRLTGSNISEKDYIHAQNVWEKFGIQTLAEYSDLYLKTDVLLLSDIFEIFRNTCIATHSLDPANYFGAPGLSFDSMLRNTGVSIELFTDVDMLMFTEKGIRGGVSQINKRYVRANNKYMDTAYEPSKENSYLLYLDGKYD